MAMLEVSPLAMHLVQAGTGRGSFRVYRQELIVLPARKKAGPEGPVVIDF